MRYYCANMQTFSAHYSSRGNWPQLFTALIRVIFGINTHFTHLLAKRCWNCTILPWQKPFWSVISRKTNFKSSIWKWQRRHFRKLLEVARFSLRDVTMAKIVRTNKLPSSPPPAGFTQQEGILHAHAWIRGTTRAWVHQIWWREIKNSRVKLQSF